MFDMEPKIIAEEKAPALWTYIYKERRMIMVALLKHVGGTVFYHGAVYQIPEREGMQGVM